MDTLQFPIDTPWVTASLLRVVEQLPGHLGVKDESNISKLKKWSKHNMFHFVENMSNWLPVQNPNSLIIVEAACDHEVAQ